MSWTTVLGIVAGLAVVGALAFRRLSAPPDPSAAPKVEEPDIVTKNSALEDVRGKRLRVVRVRHPKGDRVPWIAFVHGLGGTVSQFADQIDFFSRGANILTYDFVGAGQSERPAAFEPYTTRNLLLDLVAVLETIPRGPPLIIVAHSYGSSLAPMAANLLANSPRAVVLLGPGNPQTPRGTYERLQKLAKAVPEPIIEVWRNLLERPGGLESASVKRYVSSSATPEMKRKQWAFNEMSSTPVVRRMMAGVDLSPISDALRELKPPTLVVAGAEDGVTPPENAARVAEILQAGRCAAVVGPVVLAGSHNMMVDSAHEVNDTIRAFLCGDEIGLREYFALLV